MPLLVFHVQQRLVRLAAFHNAQVLPLNQIGNCGNRNCARVVCLHDLRPNRCPSADLGGLDSVVAGQYLIAVGTGDAAHYNANQQTFLLQLLSKGFELEGRVQFEANVRRKKGVELVQRQFADLGRSRRGRSLEYLLIGVVAGMEFRRLM